MLDFFDGEEMFTSRFPPDWKITPCWLSATDYSLHSQLLSIFRGRLVHPKPEDEPCNDRDPFVTDTTFLHVIK